MISISQIILVFFAIYFIIKSIYQFIKKEAFFTPIKFLSSFFIWSGVLFFSVFPGSARIISQKISIGENLSMLIFIGFVIIFFILFKLLQSIEILEKNITEIVRYEALNNKKNKI